jgi:hypothetical protein
VRAVKADLHNHFGHTPDPVLKIGQDRVVDYALEKLGRGGILGLTDFFGLYGDFRHYGVFAGLEGEYEKVDLGNALYFPEKDILVVRGEEIALQDRGKECHVLVFGNSKPPASVKAGTEVEKAIDLLNRDERIIVLDHPFFMHGVLNRLKGQDSRIEFLLGEIDGLEVHNSSAIFGNRKSQRFYEEVRNRHNIGGIISSDAHALDEMCRSYFLAEVPRRFNGQAYYNSLRGPAGVERMLRHAITFSGEPEGRRHTNWMGMAKHALNQGNPITTIKRILE